MSSRKSFPAWISDVPPGFDAMDDCFNCREVGDGLFVGAFGSPILKPWPQILALSRSGLVHARSYPVPPVSMPFEDGEAVPVEVLTKAWEMWGKGPLLIHCAAGLSRSASVAYALLVRGGVPSEEALRRIKVEGNEQYPMRKTLASAHAWATQRRWLRR